MATGASSTAVDKALYQYAPPAMAFDSAGNLWVANSLTVVAFKLATLTELDRGFGDGHA